MKASSGKAKCSVAGTLLGKNNPRIVAIDEQSVDVVPEGAMMIYTNVDKPGVIGYVGTILGKNQINIAGMKVGRKFQKWRGHYRRQRGRRRPRIGSETN